jgi:hypothetical protein
MQRLVSTKTATAALLALLFINGQGLAENADESRPPPPPAWVNLDGTINMETAPKEVIALDSEGAAYMESGKEKMVPTYIGQVPPDPLRQEVYPQ